MNHQKTELSPREKFIHREISWLNFNERVMDEASDLSNPLLERLKFLAIFINNLDEFIMVRVAGLRRLLDSGFNQKDIFGYYPFELFQEIRLRVEVLFRKLYDIFELLNNELKKNKIFIKTYEGLTGEQKKYINRLFEQTIFPTITPMAVDQGRPFPLLSSKTIAFAVSLKQNGKIHLAIIPVPQSAQRVIRLPSERHQLDFILLDEVIREFLPKFFRGFEILHTTAFRLMRDSELSVDEEFAEHLLKAIEEELRKRPRGKVVCLELERACDKQLKQMICEGLDFSEEDVITIKGDLDLSFLFELIHEVGDPQLSYPDFKRGQIDYEDIFERIKESDFLLHLPFQSFQPTVDLIQSAACDENVLAIKMTLYRTNEDSAIIAALKKAAENKKQVTVLVEIKARFEEKKNINWSRELEEAGCHVIYGIANMKIHSKITLIVRKEEGRIRRYVHLSTGNYNEKTAKIYSDMGYFTVNDDFARDISDVFNVITGYSLPSRWKRIISSPNDLRQYFFELINQEIEYQQKYKNGQIFAKFNSLEDPKIIEKLYEASQAGVKIRLVVRGICCLIPGVKGFSDNIEVRSIVGRFLEHTRIFIFHNNTDQRIFLSSADWMRRNLDRRIELLFEITKTDLKDHIRFVMKSYWKDNVKSRILKNDKNYIPLKDKNESFNVQDKLIEHYS